MAVILGIDPGSQITGWGVVELKGADILHIAHGSIHAPEKDVADRITFIGLRLREILAKYKPDVMAIEEVFYSKNVDSLIKLAHARSVAIYESKLLGAQVVEYSTREVKKGVTGNGNAQKEQVAMSLLAILGVGLHTSANVSAAETFDATDGLALAFHHAAKIELAARMQDRSF